MRPVNLLPSDARRDHGGSGSALLAYAVVGLLLLALATVTVIALTNNEVSSSRAELVRLEQRQVAAQQDIDQLSLYTEFATLSGDRVTTVSDLAESRFDWQRVMNELALIIPGDIWLTNLTGTVSPTAAPEGAPTGAAGAGIAGPSLAIVGCGVTQDAVARFIAALGDIDGVTRVGLQGSSTDPSAGADGADAEGGGTGGATTADCQTESFIAGFQIVVAFDAVAVPVLPAVDQAQTAADAGEAAAPAEDKAARDSANDQIKKAKARSAAVGVG